MPAELTEREGLRETIAVMAVEAYRIADLSEAVVRARLAHAEGLLEGLETSPRKNSDRIAVARRTVRFWRDELNRRGARYF